MEKSINLTEINAISSEVVVAREDIIAVNFGTSEGSGIEMPFSNGLRGDSKYLTFEVYSNKPETCCCMHFEFYSKENKTNNPDFFFILGFLPEIYTTVSLPLEALDGSKIFLDRVPGAMKFLTHGKNLAISDVDRFGIKILKSSEKFRVQFANMRFTDEPVKVLPEKKPLIDEIGQWLGRDFPLKVKNEAEMIEKYKERYENSTATDFGEKRSEFGGWTELKLTDGDGFFGTYFDGKRWWLCDPDGYAFFSSGLDCVSPDESFTNLEPVKTLLPSLPEKSGIMEQAYRNDTFFDFAVSNLIKTFGEDWFDKWAHMTKSFLYKTGFNTVANWSNKRFYSNAKLPYVLNLKGFPKTEKMVFRDFPDVFSDEYMKNSEIFAQQMGEYKDDKYLIGYFLSNEPNWAWGETPYIAEDLLRSDNETETNREFIRFLKERYGDIESLNRAWDMKFAQFDDLMKSVAVPKRKTADMQSDISEFSKIMIMRYCKLPSQALRAVDAKHLNLGLRFASVPHEEILAGSEYFDVISMNCYKIDPRVEIEKISHLGKPVMIGEYHFGALDAGLPATGLRAVTTQKERGNAYKYYLSAAASMPCCVGAHYFTLNDQAALGRGDGENYQIGFINVCGREYEEITLAAKEIHSKIYDIAAGRINKYNIYPDETDWLAF